MGKAVKSIGGIFGLGGGRSGSGAGDPNMAFFDIEKEISPFKEQQQALLDTSLARAQAVEPAQSDVLAAMGQAALGKGPSLAEAQLKQAQDRNLAQQLAAVQAQRGGSAAANQRALIQSMSGSGRELAQQAAIERLNERDRFLQQATQAGQVARQDIGTGVDLATMAKREKQKAELARAEADLKRTTARKQQQAQIGGRLLGAGMQAFASSDERVKNIDGENNKKVSGMSAIQNKIANKEKLTGRETAALFGNAIAEGLMHTGEDKKESEIEKGVGSFADAIFGNNKKKDSKIGNKKVARSFIDVLLGNKIGQPGPTSTIAKMEGIDENNPLPNSQDVLNVFNRPAPGSVVPPEASIASPFTPSAVNPAMFLGSDEDMKKSKKELDVRDKFEDFLSKLKSKSYTYKNPGAPGQSPGQKYGIVAQDLEKSEVGKTLVKDTPYGKMVDVSNGFGAVLASQAELNNRLKKIEGSKKKKEKK